MDPVIDSTAGIYSVRLPVDPSPYVVWSGPDSAPPQPPAGNAETLHTWRLTTPSLVTTVASYTLPLLPLTGLTPGEGNSVSIAALASDGTQGPWSEPVRFKPEPLLTALPPVMKYFDHAILRWVDYDRDGDLDLFLTGRPYGGIPVAHRPYKTFLYRNDGNGFTEVRLDIPCVFGPGDIQFGDYDNDGDLDLLLSGSDDGGSFVLLYRNDGGKLVESGISLPAPGHRLVRMLDYDGTATCPSPVTPTAPRAGGFATCP